MAEQHVRTKERDGIPGRPPRWSSGWDSAFQCRVRPGWQLSPRDTAGEAHTLQREKAHACRSKDPAQSEPKQTEIEESRSLFPHQGKMQPRRAK